MGDDLAAHFRETTRRLVYIILRSSGDGEDAQLSSPDAHQSQQMRP